MRFLALFFMAAVFLSASCGSWAQITARPTPVPNYGYEAGDLLGTANSRILDGTSMVIMYREFLDLANSPQGLRDVFLLMVEGYSSAAVADQIKTATPGMAQTQISEALARKLISMQVEDQSMQHRIREILARKEFDSGNPMGSSRSPLAFWIAKKSGPVQERLKLVYDKKVGNPPGSFD